METGCVLFPSYQKMYSALSCLNKFGAEKDFFENISLIDQFFSEFRNITFVLQKSISGTPYEEVYERFRDMHLSNKTMKWFKDKRNETIKEGPFKLEKQITINIYTMTDKLTIIDDRLTIDSDVELANVFDIIRKVFIDHNGLVEVYFSVLIKFLENGFDIDIYEVIKSGLFQMQEFLKSMHSEINCNDKCQKIREKIDVLYGQVMSKNLFFSLDYELNANELISGDRTECFWGFNDKNIEIAKTRCSMKNGLLGKGCNCIMEFWHQFMIMHIAVYKMQNKEIFPAFLVLYDDFTYTIEPIITTTKATQYRVVHEIAERIKREKIILVFYVGEQYLYEMKSLSDINGLAYKDRINLAKSVILAFDAVSKDMNISVLIDSDRIDDNKYISKQISNPVETVALWLMPIKRMFEKEN